jgi:hypothetical protein
MLHTVTILPDVNIYMTILLGFASLHNNIPRIRMCTVHIENADFSGDSILFRRLFKISQYCTGTDTRMYNRLIKKGLHIT